MLKSKLVRVHINFDKELLDIANERIANGKEKNTRKPVGTMSRLTLGIIRHPDFKKIKKELTLAELKEEKFLS